MTFEQVVITLTPVYSPDTLPFRSLTFSSNEDTTPIGRASKSEAKNLVPEHDNGWFDSRVMSRNHAVLSVRMEESAVFIRDHGSLHGTQLNDVKIAPKVNVAVNSGDVLTFGSEISRGTQTFRPIAVRLDCQWHESKQAHATPKDNAKPNTNTFSVPEEEDEMVEVVEFKAAPSQEKPLPNASDSSDFGYGSDISRPLDLTSPVTSPEIKVSRLPELSSTNSNKTEDPKQDSLLSPPQIQSTSSDPLEHAEAEHHSDSGEEGSSGESEDSVDEGTRGIFEDASEESEDDQSESSDIDKQVPSFSVFDGEPSRPIASFNAMESLENRAEPIPHDGNQPILSESNAACAQPGLTTDIREPTSNLIDQSRLGTDSGQYTVSWPEYIIQRIPSPSDKAMAKPLGAATASTYQPYSTYSSGYEMWSNNQGPSHPSYPNVVNLANPYGSIDANESFPFGPHRSSGYLRNMGNNFSGEGPALVGSGQSFENTETHRTYLDGGKSEISKENEKPVKTRVSISDIVDESTHQSQPSTSNKLKRKAAEIDMDASGISRGDNSQDSLPDAQPRADLPNIGLTQSSLINADSIKEVRLNDAREKSRKRIKTRHTYSFIKYATAAAVGVAIGSIGTIAGLASLPTDFFN